MSRFLKVCGFAISLWILLVGTALAAPGLINYQGTLTDAGGLPVNGDVTITFALFDAESGGVEQWSEVQTVTVENGAYHVLLGATPFPADLFQNDNLWLQLTVDGEVLLPRQQLTSVPYAINARSAGCNPGDFIYCFNADPAAIDVGFCQAGKRFCLPDGSGFGDCTGEVLPVAETCNDLDDDCNGQIDDNAADASTWYVDSDGDGYGDLGNTVGACVQPPGTTTDSNDCLDSDATVFPGAQEICDGLDNDCNTLIDDDCSQPPACSATELTSFSDCYVQCSGYAPCVQNCLIQEGVSSECLSGLAELEQCSQMYGCGDLFADAECYQANCPDQYQNTLIGLPPVCPYGTTRTCGSNVGECQAGVETCGYGGVWTGVCEGAIDPAEEICGNGLDDDCDGAVDNSPRLWCPDADLDGFPGSVGCVNDCVPPADFIEDFGEGYDCDDADPDINPGSIELCDGLDNNCDGQVDVGCVCSDGQTQTCGTNVGECQEGVQTCEGSDWGACVGEVAPSTEFCDGLDNDCNGQVDDNCISCNFDNSGGEAATIGAPDAIYQAQDSTGLDTLRIEMYGNYSGPGTYPITDEDYSVCATCVLIYEDDGAGGLTHFLADSGVLELTGSDPLFAGSITGANLVEVTIDPGTFVSTPVPDGATRCLDNYTFSVNTAPPVDADADGFDSTVDCDDSIAEYFPGQVWYADCDADGAYTATATTSCLPPASTCTDAQEPDGGWSHTDPQASADCDDENAESFPGQVWYADCDADGSYTATATTSCLPPASTCTDAQVPDGGWSHTDPQASADCNDDDASNYPGNTEVCDGVDNNCDDQVDEGCATLFFSEYLEGIGNNKALEIFNPTADPVDLSLCEIQLFEDGASADTHYFILTGMLLPNTTRVVCNPSIESPGPCHDFDAGLVFDGNDGVALYCDFELQDFIGERGIDPGIEWGVPPVSTQNSTLRRQCLVETGDVNDVDGFDPLIEWDGYPVDDFSDLGQHCGAF